MREWERQNREREDYITALRTEQRDRLSAAFQAATHWGGFVLKALVAVNSGALITGAALLTDRANDVSDKETLQQSLIYLIAGVMVATSSAAIAYFNALALQKQIQWQMKVIALQTRQETDEIKAEIQVSNDKAEAAGFQVNILLWVSVTASILSAVLFLIGVRLMFVAL